MPSPDVSGPKRLLRAELDEGARPAPGEPIQLWVRVHVAHPLRAQATLSVRLPADVALVEGAVQRTLDLGSAASAFNVPYVLVARALPDADAVFSLSARGPGFGYHATLRYRFGRPPPPRPPLPLTSASLQVSGRPLGRSVLAR